MALRAEIQASSATDDHFFVLIEIVASCHVCLRTKHFKIYYYCKNKNTRFNFAVNIKLKIVPLVSEFNSESQYDQIKSIYHRII